MSFTSWTFAPFVAVVFLLYYAYARTAWQVGVLVVASLVFYAADNLTLLPLLLFAIVVTFYALRLSANGNYWAAAAGIATNLALLAFFKYKFLVVDPRTWVADGWIGYFVLLPLPIGISFFVFHNISAIVDFFKLGKVRSVPSLSELTLYILFFPQLVSGPITKAARFFPQIEPKSIRNIPYVQIAKLLILGYFMKLYVANNLNEFTAYMAPEVMDRVAGGDRLLLIFLYSYQIYADFFGYSIIALALGLLFGYRLPINFNLPYIAASFSEFWTRWHISLSSWLRDYLYIPLGGNRHGQLRTNLNLMIVMGLGGLWHGASVNYLLWGLLHGVYLVAERALGLRRAETRPLVLALRIGVVFVVVSLSWLLFRFADFGDMVRYASGIARDFRFAYAHEVYLSAALCVTPVMLQHLFVGGCPPRIAPLLYGGMLALVVVANGPDTTFIYFRF